MQSSAIHADDIKRRAYDKIEAELLCFTMNPPEYWKIDQDRQRELEKLDALDIETLKYILTLIEKDI